MRPPRITAPTHVAAGAARPQSNLIKSAVLLAYTPSAAATLYHAIALDDWSTPRIRAMGVLYAIPDAVSLLLVSRMATSTKVT